MVGPNSTQMTVATAGICVGKEDWRPIKRLRSFTEDNRIKSQSSEPSIRRLMILIHFFSFSHPSIFRVIVLRTVLVTHPPHLSQHDSISNSLEYPYLDIENSNIIDLPLVIVSRIPILAKNADHQFYHHQSGAEKLESYR